jgi:hypothetical protein
MNNRPVGDRRSETLSHPTDVFTVIIIMLLFYHRSSFPWYFSWANGEPHHSGFKSQIVALSKWRVMFLVPRFFVQNVLNVVISIIIIIIIIINGVISVSAVVLARQSRTCSLATRHKCVRGSRDDAVNLGPGWTGFDRFNNPFFVNKDKPDRQFFEPRWRGIRPQVSGNKIRSPNAFTNEVYRF